MNKSLSIIVPFYNENKTIISVYKKIKIALKAKNIKDYEIIFVDDFSSDFSSKKIQSLMKKDKKIKLIKNSKNFGFANSLKRGFKISRKKYLHFVPGDDEHPVSGLIKIYEEIGKYDVVIPYVLNKKVRSLKRIFLSKLYTSFINFIFFKKIPYYNGLILYDSKLVKKKINNINNSSFGFLAELLLNILRIEDIKIKYVGYNILKSKRKTNAFKINNILKLIYGIIFFRFRTLI